MANKRIIKCQVNDEYVLGSGVVVGAAGSHDDVVLRLTFGDMWIGLTKYATFRDSKGENPSTVPIEASMLVDGESMTYDVHIPEVAKRYEGKMMLTLSGYLASKEGDGDGARYIKDMTTNTTTAYFRVLPSDVALLDDGTVDGTLADWVTQQVERMSAKVEELDNATDGILEAEAQREENENDRQSAEATRKNNEQIRQENEQVRIDNESSRETTEIARIEAESARKTAENARKEAESERETAEESRGKQFGDVEEAVRRIQGIQQDIDEGAFDKFFADITQMQGGWYNGNDADTNELIFDFVPKVIVIVENVVIGGNSRYEALGVIFPEGECILRFASYANDPINAYVNIDEVTVTSDGTSVKLISTEGSPDDIFNVQSLNDDGEIAQETDGYGYWYYAFG
jgi:hypothetical protein